MTRSSDAPQPGSAKPASHDPENRDTRERRLRLRSWRRGIREMDLILGGFADARLSELTAAELARYDALLSENDQDLYAWVSGREEAPADHAAILALVAEHLATDPAGRGAGPG